MTRGRLMAVACATTLVLAPTTGRGQNVVLPDTTLEDRASTITVGDYCAIAKRTLGVPAVVRALGDASVDASANAAIICDPRLANASLLAVSGRSAPRIGAVAHVRTSVYSDAQQGVLDAMSGFRSDVRSNDVRPMLPDAIGKSLSDSLMQVAETANELVTGDARSLALDRLANYERKLGPGSARLNFAEVLLNYSAGRWIPFFKSTPLGGPSPLELVASYAPGYITFATGNRTPIPVSAAELGVRWYLFGKNFGRSGLMGVVLPSYWSAGILTASDDNGALVWPWKGVDHTGGFVSWGSIKVGYVHRASGSWLVSKQFQAVPFVF